MKKIIFSTLIGMFLFAGAFVITYNTQSAAAACSTGGCFPAPAGQRVCGCSCKSTNCAATTTCFYCSANPN